MNRIRIERIFLVTSSSKLVCLEYKNNCSLVKETDRSKCKNGSTKQSISGRKHFFVNRIRRLPPEYKFNRYPALETYSFRARGQVFDHRTI